MARFPNGPVEREDGLHWDLPALLDHCLAGLRAAGPVASIGVDAWAIDYGLLRGGELLDLPWCYRDARTAAGVEAVHARIAPAELYRRTGLQFLPFNTIYQLAAERRLAEAEQLLLVPDLVTYWLTGRAVCERTNASTTGLLDVHTRDWAEELCALVGLVPGSRRAGRSGHLVGPPVTASRGTPVVAVGSHDTASAVVGVPMTDPDAAYVSCGTWGLVGVELDRPVVTEEARAANFTNEGGVDGRVRFLTNVMGTWLLSESLRTWAGDGAALADETGQTARAGGGLRGPEVTLRRAGPTVPPPGRPAHADRRLVSRARPAGAGGPGRAGPQHRRQPRRGFATAVEQAAALSGRDVRRVHVVGGGAQNALLCGLLADRLGLPVLAGPVEATALGNVLVQARAHGALSGTLEDLRALVARTQPLVVHQPHGAPMKRQMQFPRRTTWGRCSSSRSRCCRRASGGSRRR